MSKQKKGLLPILKDVDKQKPNQLAKRLYKNNSMKKLNNTSEFSYLNTINPDSSILGSTLSRNYSGKNLLIPAISRKRSKDMQASQRSMQISHGKIFLTKPQQPSFLHYKGDLKYKMKKLSPSSSNSSGHKNLFKKLPRFDKSDEIVQRNIIPDQLLGCSSDNQGNSSFNVSKIQKSSTSPKSRGNVLIKGLKSKTHGNMEQQQTLTPNDFIQLVQQDGTITNQFCYLKKMSHPYDLKIVEFENSVTNSNKSFQTSAIPPQDEYITISSRGVSYFSKQNSRFVPLQRWKKQAYFFNKLMNLQFFSKYRLFKNFAKWKKYIRKTAMKSTTEKLKNELLIGDRFLRKALLNTRENCYILQNDINYCKFNECENVMHFNKFKLNQDYFIQNEFQKRIGQIESDIKHTLLINLSDSMRQFKQQNKISTSSDNKGIPLLIGDEKNLDMPYTKEATLRTHQEKFKKFLKLVEFLIIDAKIKMMDQSTINIVKKIQQDTQNYQKQVIQSNYKFSYKGKQYLQCFASLNLEEQTLLIKPTKEELNYMFEDIVNKSIIKLCKNHKRIINDQDVLQIIYDSHEKIVKQSQNNILKVIIMGDDRQQKIVNFLNQSINIAYSFIEKYSNKFSYMVDVYFENLKKFQALDNYTAKDHEIIKQSLQNWRNQLTEINSLSQQHQAAIFLLNLREFKQKAIKCVSECLQKTKKMIPQILKKTSQTLLQALQYSLKKIQTKPIGIQSFIQYQNNKNQITNNLQEYGDKLAQINCIWIIMKSNSNSESSTISRQQRQINKLQTILNSLRTKLQEAEMNTKVFENRAQEQVKQFVPKIKQNIYKLYTKIKAAKYDVNSNIKEVMEEIEKNECEYQNILTDIDKIKSYQKFLNMEGYNDETINKFTNYFNHYKDIWNFRKNISDFQMNILDKPWTTIDVSEVKKQIQDYFKKVLKMKKKMSIQNTEDDEFKIQLNDIDVLSFVFLQAKNMKPLIQTIQCLRDKSLGEKEFKEIKNYFEKNQKSEICEIIDLQNKQASVRNILDLKITDELSFLQNIVFKSKKQLQINNKMHMVNKFWIQNNSSSTGRSLTQNFDKAYWDIVSQIDQKITVINGINEDSQGQSLQLKQNVSHNKMMFETLRNLLTQWEIHQRYLLYFEPIFTNSYWKASKEMKLYASAQNNWKKLLKQCKDYSLKRWASNQKAISTLKQNISLFQQLKKAVQEFLAAKRQIFPKFYFLSNQQLLHILLEEKDFKSVEKHINTVFFCLKSLDIKQDNTVPTGVYNLSSQYLPLKFARMNNFQIEEMFKSLEENIKQSIRLNLRNCLNTFEKDQFNRKLWTKQNILQVLLFIQRAEYTKIIQYDYLGSQRDDLSQYLIYQNTQIKELQHYLKEDMQQQGLQIRKVQILLLQELQHRQITEMLINQRVINEDSYEWQKQIRCYYNTDATYTKFFVNQIEYGNQFVNIQSAYQYMLTSQKEFIQLTNVFAQRYSPVLKGRQNLVSNFCKMNAKNYAKVICDAHISSQFLFNACMATYLTNSYLQLSQAEYLSHSNISMICNYLKEIYSSLNRKVKVLPFGMKRDHINSYSGIIFRLSQLQKFQAFTNKLSITWRSIQFGKISLTSFITMVLQIQKKTHNNLGKKIMRIVQIINEFQEFQILNFQNIKPLFSYQRLRSLEDLENYFCKEITQLLNEKVLPSKKLFFYKKVIHQVIFSQKDVQELNYQPLQTTKTIKDKSDFKFVVNKLIQITSKKTICILSGPTQSGKMSIIAQAYRQKVSRNVQVQSINLDLINDETLLGQYRNDLWREGHLIKKLKKLQAFKQEWLIFQGTQSPRIRKILKRFNSHVIQLPNGQIVSISPQWKVIVSMHNFNENLRDLPKQIEIINSSKFISVEEALCMNLQKRIRPYFENISIQNYNLLFNMCVNNFQKIITLLKVIGFKNQFTKAQNLLRYFINILDAILFELSQKIIQSKQFSKGIQKVFIWSTYWCLGSGIPNINSNKFQKSLFQLIKTDIQRSQNISLLTLNFQSAIGIFKKIKNQQVKTINGQAYLQSLDLKSKFFFSQMMIKRSYPLFLTGKTGAGKTKFMEYLSKSLCSQKYTFLKFNLSKSMTSQQLENILFKKTRISIKHNKKISFCSSTNKKLIILIDDFNLLQQNSQVGQFLCSCIKHGYYYDLVSKEKIYLYNITFVVAQNDTYENRLDYKLLKHFKPIYINEIQLKDIEQIYLQDSIENENNFKYPFDSCVSLNNFVLNLQQTKQLKFQQKISQKIAIRIMKCLRQYSGEQSIAKVWAYLVKKQYTSLGISNECSDKIEREINNLLNLMTKDTAQKPKPVAYSNDLCEQLRQKFSLIKIDQFYEEYYQYLSFLISLAQPHNLLCINELIPQSMKSQHLSYVAEIHSYSFQYIKDLKQLKSIEQNKNTIIYLSADNQSQLFKILNFVFNSRQVKECKFVLDCPNRRLFKKLLQNFPSITSFFHIFTKQNDQFQNVISKEFVKLLKQLQQFLGQKVQQREYVNLSSTLIQKQLYVKSCLKNKKSTVQQFITKYVEMDRNIQNLQKQILLLSQLLKSLQEQEQKQFMLKKELSQNIIALKNKKFQDQQDQQQNFRKIKKLQQEVNESQKKLKQFKSKKNQSIQKLSNIQNIMNAEKEVQIKIQNHYKQMKNKMFTLLSIQKNIDESIFMLSLIYYSNKSKRSEYFKFVTEYNKKYTLNVKAILNVLFDIDADIDSENLILWVMDERKSIIQDNHGIFVKEIKHSSPNIKIYNDFNNIIHGMKNNEPQIYIGKYDSKILNLKYTSIIMTQQEITNNNLKNRFIIKVKNSLQSQNQLLCQNLLKHFQPVLTQQINSYLQEVNLLQMQSQEQNKKIIELYTSLQVSQSLKPLEDIKKQINIFYATKDRLEPLYANLAGYQRQRKMKNKQIISLSLSLNKYLSYLNKRYSYFSITTKKLQNIVKQCSQGKKKYLRTTKTLKSTAKLTQKKIEHIEQKKQQSYQAIQGEDLQSQEVTFESMYNWIIKEILQIIVLGLKSQDALYAYALLGTILNEYRFNFSSTHQVILLKFGQNKEQISLKEQQMLQELERQTQQLSGKMIDSQQKIKKISISIKNFYQAINSTDTNLVQKIKQFGNNLLQLEFDTLLKQKYQNQSLLTKKDLIVLSHPNENPYKILETSILSRNEISNWCYFFQDSLESQKLLQISQKNPFNCFVIINLKNKNHFNLLRNRKTEKQCSFIYFFTSQDQFIHFKRNLQTDSKFLDDLTSIYIEQFTSVRQLIKNTYQDLIYNFSWQKPQIQKLSRIPFYEQVNTFLKQIYYQHCYPIMNNFYWTKTVSNILKQLKNIPINHFIKMLEQICYINQPQKQKIILKQTKNILSKRENISQNAMEFISNELNTSDQVPFEGSCFINESAQHIMQSFNKNKNNQQILSMFLPTFMKKKYPCNKLHLNPSNIIKRQSVSNKKISQNNDKKIPLFEIIQKLQQLLNNFPSFSNIDLQNFTSNKRQKFIFKDIIKDQVRIRLSTLNKIQDVLKNYKKLIENHKILSQSTESQLQIFLNKGELMQLHLNQKQKVPLNNYLKNLEKNVEYLDNSYTSKETHTIFEPQHFINPISFLRFYLYEVNSQIDFMNNQIVARIFNQKDKQVHFETFQNCKDLIINEVLIKNGKFDINKNVLQFSEKNESNKIKGIHLCFYKKQGGNQSIVPLYYEKQKIVNFLTVIKFREDNIWKDKLQLQILPKNN